MSATILFGLLDAAPSPRAPDPYVFGDPRGPVIPRRR